ncbi:MAG: acetylxylan esterase [Petrimonas sp.]|uniref:dienelactone hydrolase family protein n=1 Tax=Petrimonas sp. TaxID=2023866 RepID=UPI001BD26392|nr:acetylxylan esterase [Petrimonas sp.]MEA4981033.1 acetylxylan esterase [Petrimonas sp.]MEA5044746.1 acetylxylan esterase [Petrimonas sp.]MEA5063584.1 acetylxylan esterase [Petrimonas sp.]
MKRNLFVLLFIVILCTGIRGQNDLPDIFTGNRNNDLISFSLKREAAKAYNLLQLPQSKDEWITRREELRDNILQHARVSYNPDLPLAYKETGNYKKDGFSIKNIYFQTQPHVFATANLYIPDGNGPFPAVVVAMGHSRNGKLYPEYQALGQTLALNGYVAIAIDPWGAGERTTVHGEFEYHGANLGASLLNVGETLMGVQITDNMRAVDLLSSLPFVDNENIGATGASGGGNQVMWLAAADERIKAVVPVVSVGTFQSYILNSNCVCEVLTGGLTFTEESAVLGLIAPRALKICSGLRDSNLAFHPQEMLRSFNEAKAIYRLYDADNRLSYQIFDTPHGYFPEMREAMLGWFDLHLKKEGTGAPKKEKQFVPLPESELMVFSKGRRPVEVVSTGDYCFYQGSLLRTKMLSDNNMDVQEKKEELKQILRISGNNDLKDIHKLSNSNDWARYILETTTGDLIPILLYLPHINSTEYVLIANSMGKKGITQGAIEQLIKRKNGICIVDLWGIGESISSEAKRIDGLLPEFHTLFRSALWLNQTMQGIWIEQLDIVLNWLINSYQIKEITIDADRELAVASVLSSVLGNKADKLILREMPLSYLFDKSGNIDYFSMAIHIPDFLLWGDMSLAVAMCNKDITFIDPVTISGRELSSKEVEEFKKELSHFDSLSKRRSEVHFIK